MSEKTLKHIGFIMDGNRRWAKKLSNLAKFGHEKGGDNIENVLIMCLDAQIEYVSMWALSRENILERSADEVGAIFGLIEKKVPKLVPRLLKKGIRFETVGDLWLLPPPIRTILFDAMEETASCEAMTLILALGYSGQDEIVRAVRRAMAEGVDPKTIDEETFLTYLDSGRYPPPDLIVRTGGNIRHSGYFLYQSAYSEYHFTETLWPDFGREDFDVALGFFHGVSRNFGK